MTNLLFKDSLITAIDRSIFLPRCKPKVLIVTDGQLGFGTGSFGLSGFVEAITTHQSVSLVPTVTLAFRGAHGNVTIGGIAYTVQQNFNFATANPAVTVANYDQIWLFGFNAGGGISNAEITQLANFMNAGGGVFATGDHETLGASMNARLPRIRHMRDWATVPIGEGALPNALRRIDTVVNPGANNLFEFNDQGDNIPQRIFPNYAVTGPGNGSWTATIHQLLRLSGSPTTRTAGNPGQFSNDMDVLPDHPHESECFAVTSNGVLNGSYTEAGLNFAEFPPAAATNTRFGSEIVAFSVSGGRSVLRSTNWKPPVTPRMFGAMSAYDGHRANVLAGQVARPGRIVCDATWHHFVNVNLNGMGGAANADANLLKIFRYYQNIVDWLQPSNRRTCWIFVTLTAARFHPDLIEEIEFIPPIPKPEEAEALGRGVATLIDTGHGAGTAEEMVIELLRANEKTAAIADALAAEGGRLSDGDRRRIVASTLGKAMAALAADLPSINDPKTVKVLTSDRHEVLEKALHTNAAAAIGDAIGANATRLTERVAVLKRLTAVAR